MSDELRDLLNRVASGEISPEEAQAKLQSSAAAQPGGPAAGSGAGADRPSEAGAGAGPGAASQAGRPSAPPPPPTEPVRRISVRASAVRLIVVADASVDTAIADGPHRVAHVGDTLTIHSDLSAGEYHTEAPKSAFTTWLTSMNRAGTTLRVRVNPELPLEVLNVAGSLELSGLHAQASIGVEAGSAKLHGGSGPLALSVASGSAEVEWQFHGDSSVSTDLGSARILVLPGSDVSITAEATLGMASIRMPDGSTLKASPTGNPPVVVGAGTGRLAVTSRLGSLVVSLA
ncbi:MAG: hypothetical protein WCF04_15185 [Candidatus Nanopelagicales bacterium]